MSLEIYRQEYCGCIFSEEKRFTKNFQREIHKSF
ncbi:MULTISPECIES: epoxyqueuosine reductase QueH [Thermodesulfovibrio]